MFGTQHLSLFIVTGILLNLTPGQDTMYILGRGFWQGRKAAIISALGISTGSLIHTVAAALGLSAILATSAVAFTIVKWIGAAYLTYLGLRILFAAQSRMEGPQRSNGISAWAVYRQAILTNVLNPKVALFFIAFLPQFVDPTTSTRVLTLLFLGTCFIITGTLWCVILACASGFFKQSIESRPRLRTIIEKLIGGVFVYLGCRLALGDR